MAFIILGVIVVLVVMAIGIYNGLVKTKIRVDEAWSDITVQLKRRIDLIPNLVETVKGYAKHEKDVFQQVTEARAAMMQAGNDVNANAEADNMMQSALKSIFAVAEAYPDLKANENFKELQAELVDTEDKIQASRRFYNGAVRALNIKIKSFPALLFAGMLGFTERDFFELPESERAEAEKPVDVKF